MSVRDAEMLRLSGKLEHGLKFQLSDWEVNLGDQQSVTESIRRVQVI